MASNSFFPIDIREYRMTPLQQQVVGLGICYKCHTKTLELTYMDSCIKGYRCTRCYTAYLIHPNDFTPTPAQEDVVKSACISSDFPNQNDP